MRAKTNGLQSLKVSIRRQDKNTNQLVQSQQTKQENQANQSVNQSSLRSNLKKLSSGSKRVVIKEPPFQNVKEMIVRIQQFFMNKIISYQQQGFDALIQESKRSDDIEQQIQSNHQTSILRQVIQSWANHPQKDIKALAQISVSQQVLNKQLSKYAKQKMTKSIFFNWKKTIKENKYNFTFKSSAIKDNLNKFLQDMNVTVQQAKNHIHQGDNDLLRQAVLLNKAQISSNLNTSQSKSTITKVKNTSQYKTPSRQYTLQQDKSLRSYSKESQHNVQKRQGTALNRILFTENLSPNRQITTDQSQRTKSGEKTRYTNQPISKLVIQKKSPTRQTDLAKGQWEALQNSRNHSYLGQGERKIDKQVVLESLNKISNLFSNRCHDLFAHYRIKTEKEDHLISLLNENQKRKILFNWVQILPSLQVDKEQMNAKIQKLVKAIKNPFFKLFKQVQEKTENEKLNCKIQRFLLSARGRK